MGNGQKQRSIKISNLVPNFPISNLAVVCKALFLTTKTYYQKHDRPPRLRRPYRTRPDVLASIDSQSYTITWHLDQFLNRFVLLSVAIIFHFYTENCTIFMNIEFWPEFEIKSIFRIFTALVFSAFTFLRISYLRISKVNSFETTEINIRSSNWIKILVLKNTKSRMFRILHLTKFLTHNFHPASFRQN